MMDDNSMDILEIWMNDPRISPEMRERHKAFYAHKKKAIADLPENCKILGIEYTPEIEDDYFDIEEAAKQKPICDKCRYTIETVKDCEQASRLRSKYISCAKYNAYLDMEYKRKRADKLLGQSGLGKRFAQRRFETFNVTEETKQVYNACVDFCENFTSESKGLRLVGGYGVGKTHLVASIIHRLAEKGIAAVFVVVPELLRAIRRGFNQPNEAADELVKLTEEAELLILDDLGAEKPSDWVQEQLYVIINRRYENMLPTIITTNCTMNELKDRVGERTASRIIEMTTPYKITASDYRLKARA